MLLIYFIRTYFTKTDNLKRRENQYLDHQTHLNNFDGKLSNHLLITPHPRNSTSTIHKASKEYSIHSDRDDYLNDSSGDCLLGDTLEEEDIREAQFQSFKYFQSDLNTNTITLLKPLDTQSFLIANERVLDHLQSPTGSNSDAPTSATCKLIGNDIGLISVHSNSTINVVDGVEHKQISNSKIQNDIITNNSLSPLLFNEADDGFSDFVADLQQEYKLLKDTAPDGVYLFPDLNDDVLKWTGIIFVQCGPFQGGIYRFNIQLQHDYPKQPPLLCLTTPITHPFFQPHSGKLFLIPNMIKSNRIISILIYLKSIMELQSDIQTVIQQNINNPTFQSYLNRDVLDWFLFHPSRFMTEAKINATNSQSRIYMTEDGEVTFPEWNSHLHAGLISKVLGYSEH
ncbi:hypothetical protein BC833DRAFT_606845 [Globomyces pollinis-pini]|nr:hypothetical protein BC833DRAFT_606845 [Globomyces pollinis-pini]